MGRHAKAILEHLEYAIRRDAEKGGTGWRTTVEVAERLGVATHVARRELYSLLAAELVDIDEPIEGAGNVLWWHLAEPDEDGREPVNDNHAAKACLAA